jgi:hypothetical protein
MYSTDWSGKYPETLEQVSPYLQKIPICPSHGTYKAAFGEHAPHNDGGYQDHYFVYCQGDQQGAQQGETRGLALNEGL